MENVKWYAVPPYKNEGWKIYNNEGELVATFELREECEMIVDLFNSQQIKRELITTVE